MRSADRSPRRRPPSTSDPRNPPRSDPARRVAAQTLLAVECDGAYANLTLPRALRSAGLHGQDAAFATELAYGSLRRTGVLDRIIEVASGRDPATLDPEVRVVLRLGTYQLLHTRVPQHAAVATSVDLVKTLVGARPSGLVNAVLRKVATQDLDQWLARLGDRTDRERLATAVGAPGWIVEAWAQALARFPADRPSMTADDELAAALADVAPVTHLAVRPGAGDRDRVLAAIGGGAVAGPWSPYAIRLAAGGDPGDLPDIRAGRAQVQDEGSQLVTLALIRAEVRDDRGCWLDLCAGPGGKAAMLAGLLTQAPGAGAGRLLAVEPRPHRAVLVHRALAGTSARTLVADGRRGPWLPGSFDRVLVDAPCTGLGALRRRPEARWRRQPDDVEGLVPLQQALLRAGVEAARPGGVVAYATCSPYLRETVEVVASVVADRDDLELLDARSLVDVPDTGPGPWVQLWPHRHGTDAMFFALIRRRL